MKSYKTVAQFKKEALDAVNNLSTETKQTFWRAMFEDGKNLGEAQEIAGIEDIMVAAELVIQCHKQCYIPVAVSDVI